MAAIVYNPYSFLEDVYSNGLDYVIQNLPAPAPGTTTSIQDLNDTLFEYLAGWLNVNINPNSGTAPSPVIELLFNQVLANTANDYINLKIIPNLSTGVQLNVNQLRLINAGIAGINYNTYDSLDNFFDGFDEQIASCKANNAEKAAIYIASAVARASNDYWNNILSNGPSSPVPGTWTQYLNSSYWPVNYNNLSAWVGASYLENWRGPLHFKQ
jgi:hypothetical protein